MLHDIFSGVSYISKITSKRVTQLQRQLRFLKAREEEAQAALLNKTVADQEIAVDPALVSAALSELPSTKPAIARKAVSAATKKLEANEQMGLFTELDVGAKNIIPTLLARLPIFIPIPEAKQAALLDSDFALRFDTPFGRGRRFGPPVTTFDEDVLIAMLLLSQKRLIGPGQNLPIPVNDLWMRDKKGHLAVQICICTISQIVEEMGLQKGGALFADVKKSVKRLSHVGIELETRKKDLYLGESWCGETLRLVDVKWRVYEEEGLIYAQFSPIMVKWLKEQATYYDWSIRRQLSSPNARALHRFLSTQGKTYKAELTYIADVIYWDGDYARLRPKMEKILRQLRDKLQWCDYEIIGTGRKTPHVLRFWRP